ncbi:B-cell differentiation antigen CD72-like [Sceloporus undulatus]|uniref:B-cell differentiation antigen CD72-like n=1 Tax=Sceloporus undulatus TaxID=8520 RepID=UPI001C4A98B5|nr:B-cell differentiation antigen CD72-like [Sceloporus undulatus]
MRTQRQLWAAALEIPAPVSLQHIVQIHLRDCGQPCPASRAPWTLAFWRSADEDGARRLGLSRFLPGLSCPRFGSKKRAQRPGSAACESCVREEDGSVSRRPRRKGRDPEGPGLYGPPFFPPITSSFASFPGIEEQGEVAYENVEGPRPLEGQENPKESRGSEPWVKRTTVLGLLAACLFLLAAAVGLGVRYGQVSGQLQRASQDHAANTSVLTQRVSALNRSLAEMEVHLRQAKADLNSTQVALWKSHVAKERTRKHLEKMEDQLKDANRSLDALKREEEAMEARLCQQIGCCPSGWTLFRWKCLWVSQELKTWEESQEDCKERGSQLMLLKGPWDDRWGLEGALGQTNSLRSNGHWIGLNKEKNKWVFRWVDGSHYEGTKKFGRSPDCVKVTQGNLVQDSCSYRRRFICERPAGSMRPDPGSRPFLAERLEGP